MTHKSTYPSTKVPALCILTISKILIIFLCSSTSLAFPIVCSSSIFFFVLACISMSDGLMLFALCSHLVLFPPSLPRFLHMRISELIDSTICSVLSPILNMPISDSKRQRVLVASCVLYSEVSSTCIRNSSKKYFLIFFNGIINFFAHSNMLCSSLVSYNLLSYLFYHDNVMRHLLLFLLSYIL